MKASSIARFLSAAAVLAVPAALRADDPGPDADPRRYLVLDLTDAARPDAHYPVSFLSAPPEEGWNEDYKTNFVVLRRIDPGVVQMGSSRRERGFSGNEMPVHDVRITQPYYIGVFEITQAQYLRVMGGWGTGRFKGDMRPAESVSWDTLRGSREEGTWPDTALVTEESFIGRLRERTCIGSWDLPTEAQWEFACRAGATNSIARGVDLESTGRDPGLDRFAHYSTGIVTGGRHGMPQHEDIGTLEPNEWGLYDMHGNVAEWCLDWYVPRSGFTAGETLVDPRGPTNGFERVVRGGSWFDYARLCRNASRSSMTPLSANPRTGFRIVCAPPTEEELEASEAMGADLAVIRTLPRDQRR